MGKMSISIYMKRYYDNIVIYGKLKNKANSKPNLWFRKGSLA